tara:strand:- start:12 stop:797 length:786 start_codon:yes stop_codon:yes gene_type:complete
MKKNLKVYLIQTELFWQDKKANLLNLENLISHLNNPDIILLPEMFNTAFCPSATHLAETMQESTINWMINISKKRKCAVSGTLMIKENGNIFNRLVWISKSGKIYSYDKRHLFSLINEQKYISAGIKRLIVEEQGWKICPLICYDLRFPVYSRNDINYDVLIYLANWPERRVDAWMSLLKARAIENQCYTIGVNRVGVDGSGVFFNGNSLAFDTFGNELIKPSILNTTFSILLRKDHIKSTREKLNFLNDRDQFKLINLPN